mmetsp:Transcript_91109/g.262713  ORF Transcript_91109/g.262713 Transcript_91109/m.262713 type:complete len:243 (+) Transcript_91109:156-884(+)
MKRCAERHRIRRRLSFALQPPCRTSHCAVQRLRPAHSHSHIFICAPPSATWRRADPSASTASCGDIWRLKRAGVRSEQRPWQPGLRFCMIEDRAGGVHSAPAATLTTPTRSGPAQCERHAIRGQSLADEVVVAIEVVVHVQLQQQVGSKARLRLHRRSERSQAAECPDSALAREPLRELANSDLNLGCIPELRAQPVNFVVPELDPRDASHEWTGLAGAAGLTYEQVSPRCCQRRPPLTLRQ